jgi:hypothetical protein
VVITLTTISNTFGAQKFTGLVGGLEELIELSSRSYTQALTEVSQKNIDEKKLAELSQFSLSPLFTASLLLHTDKKVLSLIGKDFCNFYSFLEAGMLKGPSGEITRVLLSVPRKDGSKALIYVKKKHYLAHIRKSSCGDHKLIAQRFTKKNFKTTLSKLDFSLPKSKKQCLKMANEWVGSKNIAYVCSISHWVNSISDYEMELQTIKSENFSLRSDIESKIIRANNYRGKMNRYQIGFFRNLCQNIDNLNALCNQYSAKGFWNKVINGESPIYNLKYRCQGILNKDHLKKEDYANCTLKMDQDNSVCHFAGNKRYPSFFPRPSCSEVSIALENSHLYANYQDCPGRIDKHIISTVNRIIKHYKTKNFDSDSSTCATDPTSEYVDLNLEFGHQRGWDIKYCYYDKIRAEKLCYPTLLGSHPKSEYSEEKTIHKILARLKGITSEEKCTLINKKNYNPKRLAHAHGCFIQYDDQKCTTTHCPKKIMYRGKEITGIEKIGNSYLEFTSHSYKTSKFSLLAILQEQLKLSLKKIRNLTQAREFLKSTNSHIIIGIGCLEQIYPQKFKIVSFNQCNPITFILDGMIEDNLRAKLIFRSAIDDVHSPRIIEWSYIFNSIKSYQQLHPKKEWGLYGLH